MSFSYFLSTKPSHPPHPSTKAATNSHQDSLSLSLSIYIKPYKIKSHLLTHHALYIYVYILTPPSIHPSIHLFCRPTISRAASIALQARLQPTYSPPHLHIYPIQPILPGPLADHPPPQPLEKKKPPYILITSFPTFFFLFLFISQKPFFPP